MAKRAIYHTEQASNSIVFKDMANKEQLRQHGCNSSHLVALQVYRVEM